MRIAIMGASGYLGGELARLLLGHPRVELAQVSSNRFRGRPLALVHPNLRGRTSLRFVAHEELEPADVLFLALPHGTSMYHIKEWGNLAPLIVDLSADFRLRDPSLYERYYGAPHPIPILLERFIAGIPELRRAELLTATRIAVPGCMANAGILALWPLVQLRSIVGPVVIDALTGSSGSGASASSATHHAERSGSMRVFQPGRHRHEAEVAQAIGTETSVTATAVEAVRGIQLICHVTLRDSVTEHDLWQLYREAYGHEPFVRLVKQQHGLYRLPEPKILAGTNYCDIGFGVIDASHILVMAALDNLVKGGAGNAVQCLNIANGWDERTGLEFTGLHPI